MMIRRGRVQEIFRDVFDQPALVLRDDMSAAEIPNWDSLNHINLVMSLEAEWGTQFRGEEIAAVSSVGDIMALLSKYGLEVDGDA